MKKNYLKPLSRFLPLLLVLLFGSLSASAADINVYGDVNLDGEVTVADVNSVIDVILNNDIIPTADVNSDGEINIADVNTLIDIILNGGGGNEGGIVELTEMERGLSRWTCNEDSVKITTYSYADSIELDALAREVIELFAPKDSDENEELSFNTMLMDDLDDLAEDAIRGNGKNIFDNSVIIEQQDWNSGHWGNTRYGGFETYFNTHVKNGKRCLLVVFYYKGGFPNKRTASIRLGQVNSGKFIDAVSIDAGQEYAFIDIKFDEQLGMHGCVNYFPLLVNNESKARYYLNPIMVETKPIIDSDWQNQYYRYEFGTINGVSVCYNLGKNESLSGDYQCVELCKRYIVEQYDFINHPYASSWGNAINWPQKRENDMADWGDKYMVFVNDGYERPREGDIIVWNQGNYGHVGVIIKTGKEKDGDEYIKVAHQNGGVGTYALPIGMKLKVEDKVIKNVRPGTNYAPIFSPSTVISHFIRVYNKNEVYSSYDGSMTASTTYLKFGNRDVGTSFTRKFTITNHGSWLLTISSMTFAKGDAYKINIPSCTIGYGQTKEFEVTFTPTVPGEYEDKLSIRSNAEDNPLWEISLSGKATGTAQPQPYAVYTQSNSTLTFYYDNQRSARMGTIYDLNTGMNRPGWFKDSTCLSVTQVMFDQSFANARPTTTYLWFCYMNNLQSIKGIEYLNTTDVIYMSSMFWGCSSLKNLNLSYFNTSKVKNMYGMFNECSSLTNLDVSHFNTANVTNMSFMFSECSGLSSLNLNNFNTSKVTNMRGMFYYCYGLSSLNLSSFNTANMTDMSCMFAVCTALSSLNLSNFNTAKVTNMSGMFGACTALSSLNLSNFNTANVTDMSGMFEDCSSLSSLNLSSFNTANVTNMRNMFNDCSSLSSLNLSSFNTANVTDMSCMFEYCSGLSSLNLSNFNTAKVTNMKFMFLNCSILRTVYVSSKWSTAAVTSSDFMFYGSVRIKGEKGTTYNLNYIDKAYAHIDGGSSNPGYFTSGN